MKRMILIFLSSFFLFACGGGEGDGEAGTGASSSADTNAVPTVTDSSDEDIPETPTVVSTRTMSELTVPDGFNYDQNSNLIYNIDVSGYSTDNAYISVYTSYTKETDGSYTPHFNSRVAASSLTSGLATLEFSVSSGINSVLAEVQFYDGSNPLQSELSTSESSWTF
ncbi:hypothetical protein [Vibrio marisflavi]|uniref:Lipoprotein n=1 Tax=Vibrio marisflavi CECT 7928 TaxID=634439 RepID=A0ABM9A042_9VIBR|nr:hypothetical protein [Vibrio marisflavi]CAH0536167.1 hypothetical protein VMF7928_00253 [Vibrio marisflavi CECT 7928]